jgi:hypothetical protein
MHYWKVPRQTLKQAPMRYFMDDDPSLFLKPGKMELSSESDIWKRHAKSCTKSPNLKRIMTNNNSNLSFSFLPGPGFKNKLGSSSMKYLIGACFKVCRGTFPTLFFDKK